MSNNSVFDSAIELPEAQLTEREKVLLGFTAVSYTHLRLDRTEPQLQRLALSLVARLG